MAIRGLKRAVLLDALGTLVELEPPAPRLRAELARRCGVLVSDSEAERAIAAEIGYYRQHLDEGRDEAGLAALRRRCAEVLLNELRVGRGRAMPPLEVMTEVLLGALSFRLFDDAKPALGALRESGLRLVVVSNWDTSLPGVLERLGVLPLLDGVITSAQAGFRKPHPGIFDVALSLAGVTAAEAVHVGDGPAEDLVGARGAGIDAVLVCRSEPGAAIHGGDGSVIRTLRELPSLLPAAG